MGRTLLAKQDVKGARQAFELAASKGYRAAAIDLANLLQDQSAGMFDPARAVTLLERAWNDKVPIAAYELGRIFERGLPSRRLHIMHHLCAAA
jgi:TPR repeat protein